MDTNLKTLLSEMGLTLPVSVLQQARQEKLLKSIKVSDHETLKVFASYDDSCHNGHNTFHITAELYDSRYKREGGLVACRCLHDYIKNHCQELNHLIKWHGVHTDGPLHYLENSRYWAEQVAGISKWKDDRSIEDKLEIFRATAVWPEATVDDAIGTSICYGAIKLAERLSGILVEFKQVIESLGFDY